LDKDLHGRDERALQEAYALDHNQPAAVSVPATLAEFLP
jgi:hypothetical protein